MLKCWSQVMKFLRPVCSSDFVFWFASISPWYYRWWTWLSLVEFSFISDCCWHLTGDRRIFPVVSSSALPPTIFCWFSPPLSALISHYMCATFYNTTTFVIIFFSDLLLEKSSIFHSVHFYLLLLGLYILLSLVCRRCVINRQIYLDPYENTTWHFFSKKKRINNFTISVGNFPRTVPRTSYSL